MFLGDRVPHTQVLDLAVGFDQIDFLIVASNGEILDQTAQIFLSSAFVFDIDQVHETVVDRGWRASEFLGAFEQFRIFQVLLAKFANFSFDDRVQRLHAFFVFLVRFFHNAKAETSQKRLGKRSVYGNLPPGRWISTTRNDPTIAECPRKLVVQGLFLTIRIDRVIFGVIVPFS